MKRRLLVLAVAFGTVSCSSAPPAGSAPSSASAQSAQPAGAPAPFFLDGQPFPKPAGFEPAFPEPKRTFFVSASAAPGGDGSEPHPFGDVQQSLQRLQPGDRLVLQPGDYAGAYVIGDPECSDGSEREPIQVVGRKGAVLRSVSPSPNAPAVLTVRRAFWQFRDLEISPGERARAPALLTADHGAHDVLVDRCHVHGGFRSGIVVGSGSWRITISRSEVHGFRGRLKPDHSHGIDVSTGTNEIRIVDNDLHGNGGASIGVEGPHGHGKEMSSLVEKLVIEGNRIHDDEGGGLFVRGAQGVRIAGNLFWKSGPVSGGVQSAMAIEVWTNVREVIVENNRFVGGSAAVVVGKGFPGAEGAVDGPFNVSIRRNLIQGRGEQESVGVVVGTGINVRVANNVVDGFPTGIRVLAEPPHSHGTVIANNLVLNTRSRAFECPELSGVEAFDNNFFGVKPGGRLQASIGGRVVDLSVFLKEGAMPGSKVVEGLAILDSDLARVAGAGVIDRGRPVRGLPHKGAAPDVGVAEK